MTSQVSAFSSPQLQAIILAMRGIDRETAKQIRQATKQQAAPIWRETLAQSSATRQEVRVLASTGNVLVSGTQVTMKSGHTSRKLSGGGKAWELAPAVEFGMGANKKSRVKKKGGGTFQRRSGSRFRPRNVKGYTHYPATAHAIPRLLSLWAQTLTRTLGEALEGR